jgi:transposase
MDSMQDTEVLVIGGVDAHSDTHEAAVLDGRGALLGTGTFKTTFAGYAGLLDCWTACTRSGVDVVAVESTSAYGAASATTPPTRPGRPPEDLRGLLDRLDAQAS